MPAIASCLLNEFSRARFGDARLTKRLCRAAERFIAEPSASFPDALDNDAALEGWYRFLDNPRVTPDVILSAHIDATVERAQAHARVLVVHDTTECRFSGEVPRQGMGKLAGGGYGFYGHVSMAVSDTARREPLGILGLRTHVRPDTDETKQEKKRKCKRSRPDSESQRWIEAVKSVEQRIDGACERVHVMDREGDFYESLAAMVQHGQRFVVRAQHDRILTRADDGEPIRISDVLPTAQWFAEREVMLSRRARSPSPKDRKKHPPRDRRMARLSIAAMPIVVPASWSVLGMDVLQQLPLQLVHVVETNPPSDDDRVEWWLLTNLPIATAEDVLDVVDIYRARWQIEELFKALKTGCQYEKRQLETATHLINALAVFLPIAWQLLRMRHLARVDEHAPAHTVLTKTQLDVLRAVQPERLPRKPTVRDALLAVAAMGGHLKSNGPPGWLVLGRGFEKLLTLEMGWLAALEAGSQRRRQ